MGQLDVLKRAATAEVDTALEPRKNLSPKFPAKPSEPEPGWATLNPHQALTYLYVCPQSAGVADEVLGIVPAQRD